jgi:adenosine deaminase
MEEHNILQLLEKGLCVTVNSDDPAYFGGYLNKNFEALYEALQMNELELRALVKNSFCASFLSEEKKEYFYKQIDEIA